MPLSGGKEKIVMASFAISVPELNYYISLKLVVLFYLLIRRHRVDIFAVPKAV